jgi:hypothetical protein
VRGIDRREIFMDDADRDFLWIESALCCPTVEFLVLRGHL